MAAKPSWIGALSGSSASFRAAIEPALRSAAQALAGIDLADRFVFFPERGTKAWVVDASGVSFWSGDLVGPDNFGRPATIAWASVDGGAPVAPSDEVIDASRVLAWWHELPADELRATYREPTEPPFPVDAPTSFPIRWRVFGWPDLSIEVATDRELTGAEIDAVAATLERWRDQWNSAPRRGRIHDFGALVSQGPCRYTMTVDFGSADRAALGGWLGALEGAAGTFAIIGITVF